MLKEVSATTVVVVSFAYGNLSPHSNLAGGLCGCSLHILPMPTWCF